MNVEAARILVVEDNRDTSILLRDLLVAEGYDVESVPTGEAALEALERTPETDLVVLDLMLPGMSGYDVIEELRRRPELAATPILVLSALSSPSARIRGLRDGADDYMTKPFLPEELVARTRTLVTGRLLTRRTAEIQALEEIAEAALGAGDPDVLLEKMTEIVTGVFGADAAAILLLDEAHRELRGRAASGLGDLSLVTMPADVGVAAVALSTQAPVIIPDGAASDPRVANPAIRAGGFRALMVAPLIVGGVPIGVLEIARRARQLDPRVERLLRIVADRVAATMVHARLQAEARELADVVRRIGEGVVLTDAEDAVLFANRAFAEMVGVPAEALRGRRWTELLASSSQDVGALIAQMRGSSWQGEVLLITGAGDPRPVLVSLATVAAADGQLQRIGVFRDVSREHELRFRLIREQKFRTLGSLAAGVAHNINNRLTPVLGWTEMLLERLAADEAIERDELVHALRVINQGASDSVETVRRLQDYSRPSRVRGPEGVQLRDVLEQLLALTRPQWDNEAARRGIRYEIDLKAEPAPLILAVASEIREAMLNILENALNAMPEGGRLTLHVRGDGDRAVVSIADSGRGMSPEVQRLAFEPFFTTRSSEGGSGLGLSLAQEIVHRYRGTISVSSVEGVGTTFTLAFPAISAEAARTPAFLPTLEPMRVLAVEDEPEVLDVIRAMLTAAGHTVLTAASGREALELFEREPVDVVVTDLGMPGMTGLALAEELKRRRTVPVVLLTGWADELDPDHARHVDALLAKPVTRERLLGGLAKAVPDRARPA
ncbi:MAG TPA: response regulator [Methylomirabilota bacterium]|nr:response regulator [Methylomirabilota bacterium]